MKPTPETGAGYRTAARAGVALATLLLAGGCAMRQQPATTGFEMHSLRLVLEPDGAGRLPFPDSTPLVGSIELTPLLALEGMDVEQAAGVPMQLLAHDGRFYLTAERFHSVWELTPVPGEGRALYRAIAMPDAAGPTGMTAPTLSRFGGGDAVCVRVDRRGQDPVFITHEGIAVASCS